MAKKKKKSSKIFFQVAHAVLRLSNSSNTEKTWQYLHRFSNEDK